MDLTEQVNAAPQPKADHICVLIHGLWGNPRHLQYLAHALREKHSEQRLFILAAESNSGNFTYDGIELGGERVAFEIQETLEKLKGDGYQIEKLSMVGYSLGGLVARYAIGLLFAQSWFQENNIRPMNFTTFASPHLGVRTPLTGFHGRIWNFLGARTLSMSGRQLFMIDTFAKTRQPLLSVLAHDNTIFVLALSAFKNRVLYANAVNDRSAPYYTTAISKSDPYATPNAIRINYLKNYEPTIIKSVTHKEPEATSSSTFWTYLPNTTNIILSRAPTFTLFLILFPIGCVLFLLNSAVQSVLSSRRIRLHHKGQAIIETKATGLPLVVENFRRVVVDTFEDIGGRRTEECLSTDSEESGNSSENDGQNGLASTTIWTVKNGSKKFNGRPIQEYTFDTSQAPTGATNNHNQRGLFHGTDSYSDHPYTQRQEPPEFPALALTSAQLEIIETLDRVGFRKYPVYIHNAGRSHAAIIVRSPKKSFDEGKVVVRHWLDEEFEI